MKRLDYPAIIRLEQEFKSSLLQFFFQFEFIAIEL